jgi:pSer/pThr/pTyr-binding forkhead associated (FHA) protein
MERSRQPTPRANPVPGSPGRKPEPDSEQPKPLKAAVLLTAPNAEYTLYSERVLIGRGPSCQVVVMDPLVSREHAILRITPEQVLIEDLRSANGVYVNNVRIFERQQLYDGDRLLVGTQELCVFSAEPRRMDRAYEATAESDRPPPSSPAAPTVATERADALIVLGRVARRMLEVGLPSEAERVLSDHLNKVLYGARSGLPVPGAICVAASQQALVLAKALGNGRWFNYAVELHLRAALRMSPEIAHDLAETAEVVAGVDHALFGHYLEWVRDRVGQRAPESQLVLLELEKIRLPNP